MRYIQSPSKLESALKFLDRENLDENFLVVSLCQRIVQNPETRL